nr:MAG TPA: hypothetical protein [Caudoviricetes sp.]
MISHIIIFSPFSLLLSLSRPDYPSGSIRQVAENC